MGPGNPLAAALRAAREQLLAQREFDPQAGEPYPLLLVRPEGIAAYYAAREAMKSWGCDFGYELVGDDWKLAYPPPNPRLIEVVRQAIGSARINQERLIAAAPREYPSHRRRLTGRRPRADLSATMEVRMTKTAAIAPPRPPDRSDEMAAAMAVEEMAGGPGDPRQRAVQSVCSVVWTAGRRPPGAAAYGPSGGVPSTPVPPWHLPTAIPSPAVGVG